MPIQDEKVCVIHMNDGTSLTFQLPPQVAPELVSAQVEKALNTRVLEMEMEMEMDGSLMMIPTTSIKSVQVTPAPSPLPKFVIQHATLYGRG